jgi:hypothetical protein
MSTKPVRFFQLSRPKNRPSTITDDVWNVVSKLLTTHNLEQIKEYCQRAGIFNDCWFWELEAFRDNVKESEFKEWPGTSICSNFNNCKHVAEIGVQLLMNCTGKFPSQIQNENISAFDLCFKCTQHMFPTSFHVSRINSPNYYCFVCIDDELNRCSSNRHRCKDHKLYFSNRVQWITAKK